MKIKRIKFENFRNFKDPGQIDFPTDGSVTVIYGPNGVGKTTLHQLFQWIFYGEVHFNKTASNKMYNLQYEKELKYGEMFSVKGSIDFEQPNISGVIEQYTVRREWTYQKQPGESKKKDETFDVLKNVGDNWVVQKNSKEIIEQFLPRGLSEYFFFDGENMIADLNQKGKDSAKMLRKALYSIFNLNIYDQAMIHIGSRETKSTVLGQLNMERSKNSSNSDLIKTRGLVNQAQKKLEELKENIQNAKDAISRYNNRARELSEEIGGIPSRAAQENQRAADKKTIQVLENAIKTEMKVFGKDVAAQFPYLFMSKIIEQAQYRIGLKIGEEKLIPGLTKDLVLSLKSEERCLCGHPIHDKEQLSFDEWLKKFPPLSYKYIYDQFTSAASQMSADYEPDLLVKHLQAIFEYRDQIEVLQAEISEIDNELKNGTNVDQLIEEREKAEKSVDFWTEKCSTAEEAKGVQDRLLKQYQKKYEELLAANEHNKAIDLQMEIMEEVYKYFKDLLQNSTETLSSKLCEAIQELLNKMLTSKRTVEMTKEFELSVRDSYGDEAKSEGQFAVVSFAYIGGIFKLLSEVPDLKEKEFPLILDGPFSKLDVIQRQNVINTIPSYAPQIILFSKDDLTPCFGQNLENVWTIYSNDERNVSYVEKGYDQEVFIQNEI